MIIEKITKRFRDIGLAKTLSWILFRVAKKVLDPAMIASYSQFGEDRIIDHLLGATERGYYVDVGCNDPIAYSNTWLLYQRGWRGLCIDPNPELVKSFKRVRPRDTVVQTVISNTSEVVDFYFSKNSNLISGVGPQADGHWPRTVENSVIEKLSAQTLSEVLSQARAPTQIDLLSIDVEGHELQVLQSLDLGVYQVKLIVVEIHSLDLIALEHNAITTMLSQQGYRLKAYSSPSAFFVRNG